MSDIFHRFNTLRWWRWCWVPLSYALLCVPLFWQTFATWSSALATRCVERCDSGWQNVWMLWWVARQVSQGANPFYTDQIFYPAGASLFWQTVMAANGLLMTPVTLLFGPITAFNTLALATFVVSGWSMALLAEAFTRHRWGAWLAGVLYTFAPFHVWMSYWGFAERLSIQYFPILLYALWDLSQRPRWRGVWLGAFAFLGAFFSSHYYGLFSLTYVAIWFGVLIWQHRRDGAWCRQLLIRMAVMAVLVATPILPFAWSLIAPGKPVPNSDGVALSDYLVRQIEFSATPLTFVTPGITHPWWGDAVLGWYRQYSPSYWPISLGFVVLGLGVLGVIWSRRVLASWLWIMPVIMVVLSFGPRAVWLGYHTGIPLPYDILNYIPLVKLGQRPNHFLLLVLVHLALFAAVAVRYASTHLRRPQAWAVVVAVLVCVELVAMPLQPFAPTKSAVYDAIPANSGAVLTVPFDLDDGNNMYAQWYTQRPGVTGYLPRTNPELVNTGLLTKADGVVQFTQPITTLTVLNTDAAQALTHMMERLHVEYVVYDKRFGVATNPAVLAELAPVIADQHLALYRRVRPATSGALAVLNTGWYPPETDASGRRWQWSEMYGTFWVYQVPSPRRAVIVSAAISVPAATTVVFDGVHVAHPIAFAIEQPQHIRRYQILAFPGTAADDFWFSVQRMFVAADRTIGISLDTLDAHTTTLVIAE